MVGMKAVTVMRCRVVLFRDDAPRAGQPVEPGQVCWRAGVLRRMTAKIGWCVSGDETSSFDLTRISPAPAKHAPGASLATHRMSVASAAADILANPQ